MTKIRGSLFGAGAALCLLAAVGGCIVVADDGFSSGEDEIFADEAAAAAAASQMRFGVAPQWNQNYAPPATGTGTQATGPRNVDTVVIGDWLLNTGFTSTHKTKAADIVSRGKTPYFFGYIGTSMTKKALGADSDCDGNASAKLCTDGAKWVRANAAAIASAYRTAAQGIAGAVGGKEALIHLEPDYFQFSEKAQGSNALTEDESDQIMNGILRAIKDGCPSCKAVIDFSPWFSKDKTVWASSATDFYDGWDRSVVKYVGLTGKQFPFTTGRIDNFTYKDISTQLSLPLVIVDAYTFGGGPINVDSTWLNENNVAQAVDMGVAILILSQTGDVGAYDSFIARVKGSSSSSSSSTTSSSSSSSSSSTSGSGGGGGGTTTSSSSSSSSSTGSGGSGGGTSGTGVRVEGGNINVSITPNSTWTGGYCNNVKLTKTDSGEATWKLYVPSNGATLRDFWNTNAVKQGTDFVFTGVSWNAKIRPGTTVEFGYCANGNR